MRKKNSRGCGAPWGSREGADLAQAVADFNARIGIPASLGAIGVTDAHWTDEARGYAMSDLATATNAVPFDAEKYDELFERAL